jgi:hypothetical protein
MSTNNQLRREPEARKQDLQSVALSQDTISFGVIRQHFAQDHGQDLWQQLAHGRKVLETEQELEQYLFSFGPMTERQWTRIYDEISVPRQNFAVMDYAAGQGLATIHLLDRLGVANRKQLKKCTLTDISKSGLRRASAFLEIYSDELNINCVEIDLNKINSAELYSGDEDCFVHLFSNIIDIDSLDLRGLFSSILGKNGSHQLLAVSPYRTFDGGDARFEEMAKWLAEANQRGKINLFGEVRQCVLLDRKGNPHSFCVASCEVTNGSL